MDCLLRSAVCCFFDFEVIGLGAAVEEHRIGANPDFVFAARIIGEVIARGREATGSRVKDLSELITRSQLTTDHDKRGRVHRADARGEDKATARISHLDVIASIGQAGRARMGRTTVEINVDFKVVDIKIDAGTANSSGEDRSRERRSAQSVEREE